MQSKTFAIALLLAAFSRPYDMRWQRPYAPAVRVALVRTAPVGVFEESVRRGADLGSVEAQRTAAMMNGSYALRVITLKSDLTTEERRALDSAQIIISTLSEGDLTRLRSIAARQLVLDVTPSEPAITCDALVLRMSEPVADVGATTLWHSGLERFGAQQLNERYTRASGRTMDDAAWLGWFASKVALELSIRARTTNPDSLARFARGSAARFDGQKGRALTFDPRTGVLLQPVYERSVGGTPSESTTPPVLPQCRARAP